MKVARSAFIASILLLFCASATHAQDLSKYRKFSLGASVAEIVKLVSAEPHELAVIHQRPALIQELTYWPVDFSPSAGRGEPVSQIVFNFCNDKLYRILVKYDQGATKGLTSDDLERAVSARYGTPAHPGGEIRFPTNDFYDATEKVIARWEDSADSVSLFRSTSLSFFGLLVLSKQLDAQAEAAVIESVKLRKEDAPREADRQQKKEADNLELSRQTNLKQFRP